MLNAFQPKIKSQFITEYFDIHPKLNSSLQSLSACWTSGGGDLSAGSVSRFSLVFSEDVSDLLRGGRELSVVERLSTAGDRICHDLSVPALDLTLYYGVVGVDKAGNRGAMSNVVSVSVASPQSLQTVSQVSPLCPSIKAIKILEWAQFVFLKYYNEINDFYVCLSLEFRTITL